MKKDRQIRQGIANNTKGTSFVVYEDVMDAKMACDKLNGFNFQNRYLVGKPYRLRYVAGIPGHLTLWQYCTTSQRRWHARKRTLSRARRI